MTKVNIYYGGRGLIEDPTIYTKIKKASPFYRKRSKKRMPLF